VTDDKGKRNDVEDDTYVIEDTGDSTVEQIEHEMEIAAKEAAGNDTQSDGGSGGGSSNSALAEENREVKDRYMRTLADFENYRKRADREKSDFYKYALQGVLKELLPVLDNFDRALDHAEQGDDFHKGVALIYKQLLDTLQKHGVKPIIESGVKFDPNVHEAVMSEEDTTVPAQTVTAILQKGYFLHDRLLRPAMVKVAVGGPEQG
jgi:molecular chaperone GrpE